MNKLEWLWNTGRELYRTKWTRDWGDVPSETLEQLLGKLTSGQIKQGFGECIKQAQNGAEWPPVPITFISMCKTAGIDLDGSFNRFIHREVHKDLAEKITRQQVGYNCRALADDKARKLWGKHYRDNYLKMMEGKLNIEQPIGLPEKVATKETDTMRDNFKPSTLKSAKVMDRINKIKNSKGRL